MTRIKEFIRLLLLFVRGIFNQIVMLLNYNQFFKKIYFEKIMGYFEDHAAKNNKAITDEFKKAFVTDKMDVISVEDLFSLTSGDLDLARSLLDLFKGQAQKCLTDYNQSQTAEDKVHAVHALRGAARCIAAHKLSEVAGDIENTVRHGAALADGQVEEFMALTQNVMNYITLIEARNINIK